MEWYIGVLLWIKQSDFTDWLSAFASLGALFIALAAYRVSKSALDTNKAQLKLNKSQYALSKSTTELSKQIAYVSNRCIIYPERFESVNGRYWNITFRNNGNGLAFNVKVLVYLSARLHETTDPVPMVAEGSRVINPNSEQSYVTTEGGHSLHTLHETPITIEWEELSGVKNVAEWFWSQNKYGSVDFVLKQHIKKDLE